MEILLQRGYFGSRSSLRLTCPSQDRGPTAEMRTSSAASESRELDQEAGKLSYLRSTAGLRVYSDYWLDSRLQPLLFRNPFALVCRGRLRSVAILAKALHTTIIITNIIICLKLEYSYYYIYWVLLVSIEVAT